MKKIMWSFLISLSLLISGVTSAFAGGIATYAGYDSALDTNNYLESVSARNTTSYWDSPITTGAPYAFYNHMTFEYYPNSYDNYYGTTACYIQGWDGNQWINLISVYPGLGNSVDTYTAWRSVTFNFFTPVYKFRFLAISTSSTPCAFTFTRLSAGVYQFGADQATAQTAADAAIQARDAANNTVTYAQQASQNASSAANAANSIINNYLSTANGVVQDGSGTVLTAARVAQQNAANAYNEAHNARTDIANAQSALSTKIDSSNSSLQNAINSKIDSSLSSLQTNINNSITSIQNSMPPILNKVSGFNKAEATTGTSFNASIDYSNATEFQYKIDSGSWSAWTSLAQHDANGYFTANGISGPGIHTLYVAIRNSATGPVAKGKMTFYKI
ncbi:hypothetical protein [Aneurinibacillus terranovensis]|uniref:hypothetical protein n=1 Tax=Aneurinibacillus terranovensis TaxID=278991 RepID=UPI0004221D38|nr:hypothetical protein [Aneurinibacillus terranovensis]